MMPLQYAVQLLPEASKTKLQELQFARMASEDAGRALVARMQMIPQLGADELREKMSTELAKQQQRHNQLSRIVSSLEQFLTELPPHTVLEQVTPIEIKLASGETLDSALDTARSEIKKLQQELAALRQSPLPVADQKRLAERFVADLINAGRPTINFQRDRLNVVPRGDMLAANDVLALVAWCAPEPLYRAIAREIDDLPTGNALPAAERIRRTADVAERLLQLERYETAIVERACADGLPLLHRVDVDPRALFCIVITQAKAAVA